MSEASLSALYPSATTATTAAPATSSAERHVEAPKQGAPAAPAEEHKLLASTDAKAEASAASVADASAQAAAAAEQAKRTEEEAGHTAASLYFDDVKTRNPVRWDEPALTKASDVQLDISLMKNADTSAEGDAARAKLSEALVAAGAGQTLAKELYADAGRAALDTYKAPSRESSEAELKALWGRAYETKIADAAALVQKAAKVDPSIIGFLERTGLGNDPAFIRKIANRAAAQARKANGGRVKSILGAVMTGLVAGALLVPGVAHAQMRTEPAIGMNDASGQFWELEGTTSADGGVAIGTFPALVATVTQTGGAATTAGTFQTALAQNLLRHGCVIQNTSAATEFVSVNPSPTEAVSRQLAAGAVYQCVSTQAVEITSGTAAAAYGVESW
jgi:hypothetical protein